MTTNPPVVSPSAADMLATEIRHVAEAQHDGLDRMARMETRLVRLMIHLGLDANGTPRPDLQTRT